MRSRKKIIVTAVICLITVLFFAVLYFIHKNDTSDTENVRIVELNEIESIEIDTVYYYLFDEYKYFIDFSENTVLCETEDYENSKTFYDTFTDEQAENFVKGANRYDFFSWEESYYNPNVDDGMGADIVINFKDGSVKEIHCCNEFPLTYDVMIEVFYDAFGYYML